MASDWHVTIYEAAISTRFQPRQRRLPDYYSTFIHTTPTVTLLEHSKTQKAAVLTLAFSCFLAFFLCTKASANSLSRMLNIFQLKPNLAAICRQRQHAGARRTHLRLLPLEGSNSGEGGAS